MLGRVGGRLMARGNAETERHVVAQAELTRTDEVLVVGPGPGVGLRAAAAWAGRVVGVDPSETMLAACRRRCTDLVAAGRVTLVAGDAAHTGQPDASVDVVLSVDNLMLWPDRRAGLAELRRVLRPGSRLLLSAHERWLPGGLSALTAAVEAAVPRHRDRAVGPTRQTRHDRRATTRHPHPVGEPLVAITRCAAPRRWSSAPRCSPA